jgi:hypothetical protein
MQAPDPAIWNSTTLLNPLANYATIGDRIKEVNDKIVEFFRETPFTYNTIVIEVIIPLGVVRFALVAASLIVEIRLVKTVKQETYRGLISLPKNAVSSLNDRMKNFGADRHSAQEADGDQPAMTMQEENLMNTFNAVSSADFLVSDMGIVVTGTVAIGVMYTVVLVCVDLCIHNTTETIAVNAPAINMA